MRAIPDRSRRSGADQHGRMRGLFALLRWTPLLLINIKISRALTIRVCPRPCYTWEDADVVGPAIGETVCYHNTTCFHPVKKCPKGYERCLRADDEEY